MAAIRIVTLIAAPTDRCFGPAWDIELRPWLLSRATEKVSPSRAFWDRSEQGESVTWEARHLGVRQQFTAELTVFDRPVYFRDVMTQPGRSRRSPTTTVSRSETAGRR